jgi:hypothetical protein
MTASLLSDAARREAWDRVWSRLLAPRPALPNIDDSRADTIVLDDDSLDAAVAPILDGYGVPFRVHHGFTSATVAHEVAARAAEDDRPWVALYVGDRDPSGMSMSEVDLPGRISRYGGQVLIERVAITEHDTRPTELTGAPFLPWFPADAKRGDSRYRWYVDTYGDRCWELDALSPVLLRERVEQAIRAFIDWDSWERCERAQAAEQQSLQEVLAAWKAAAS